MIEMLSDDEVRENIAANLTRILEQRGLSQSELARQSGVKQATISLICLAKRKPGVAITARLAEALDTSIDLLIASPKKSFARAS